MSDLSPADLITIQLGMSDYQKELFIMQYNSVKKDGTIAILLAIFLGLYGIDRFYVGDIGLGLLKLFTSGLCGILWIIDIFIISARVAEYNRTQAQDIARAIASQ